MANPNLLILLGNVQWKLAKLLKNNDSIPIVFSIVPLSLPISEMLPGIHLEYEIKCFPSILVWVIKIH